jgi:hypothetical protein
MAISPNQSYFLGLHSDRMGLLIRVKISCSDVRDADLEAKAELLRGKLWVSGASIWDSKSRLLTKHACV